MRPHLFVTRGSLLNFACDAWLLPTDRALDITGYWRSLPRLDERIAEVRSAAFSRGEVTALPLLAVDATPTPILTAVPDRPVRDAGDLDGLAEVARRLRDFVRVASRWPDSCAPR